MGKLTEGKNKVLISFIVYLMRAVHSFPVGMCPRRKQGLITRKLRVKVSSTCCVVRGALFAQYSISCKGSLHQQGMTYKVLGHDG